METILLIIIALSITVGPIFFFVQQYHADKICKAISDEYKAFYKDWSDDIKNRNNGSNITTTN